MVIFIHENNFHGKYFRTRNAFWLFVFANRIVKFGNNQGILIVNVDFFDLMFRLEGPDAEEVKEFVQKQVKLTESVLDKCETRGKLREKITKLSDYQPDVVPFRRGDKYFSFQDQSGLCVQVREARIGSSRAINIILYSQIYFCFWNNKNSG